MKRLGGETSVLREKFARPGPAGPLGPAWCGVGLAGESQACCPSCCRRPFPFSAASFFPLASERKGGSDVTRGFWFCSKESEKGNKGLPKKFPLFCFREHLRNRNYTGNPWTKVSPFLVGSK